MNFLVRFQKSFQTYALSNSKDVKNDIDSSIQEILQKPGHEIFKNLEEQWNHLKEIPNVTALSPEALEINREIGRVFFEIVKMEKTHENSLAELKESLLLIPDLLAGLEDRVFSGDNSFQFRENSEEAVIQFIEEIFFDIKYLARKDRDQLLPDLVISLNELSFFDCSERLIELVFNIVSENLLKCPDDRIEEAIEVLIGIGYSETSKLGIFKIAELASKYVKKLESKKKRSVFIRLSRSLSLNKSNPEALKTKLESKFQEWDCDLILNTYKGNEATSLKDFKVTKDQIDRAFEKSAYKNLDVICSFGVPSLVEHQFSLMEKVWTNFSKDEFPLIFEIQTSLRLGSSPENLLKINKSMRKLQMKLQEKLEQLEEQESYARKIYGKKFPWENFQLDSDYKKNVETVCNELSSFLVRSCDNFEKIDLLLDAIISVNQSFIDKASQEFFSSEVLRLERMENSENKFWAYFWFISSFLAFNQNDSALEVIKSAISLAESFDVPKNNAMLLKLFSVLCSRTGTYSEIIKEKLLEIARSLPKTSENYHSYIQKSVTSLIGIGKESKITHKKIALKAAIQALEDIEKISTDLPLKRALLTQLNVALGDVDSSIGLALSLAEEMSPRVPKKFQKEANPMKVEQHSEGPYMQVRSEVYSPEKKDLEYFTQESSKIVREMAEELKTVVPKGEVLETSEQKEKTEAFFDRWILGKLPKKRRDIAEVQEPRNNRKFGVLREKENPLEIALYGQYQKYGEKLVGVLIDFSENPELLRDFKIDGLTFSMKLSENKEGGFSANISVVLEDGSKIQLSQLSFNANQTVDKNDKNFDRSKALASISNISLTTENKQQKINLLKKHFVQCLASENETDLKRNMAVFRFLFAQISPFEAGSAAISEWSEKAVYEYREYESTYGSEFIDKNGMILKSSGDLDAFISTLPKYIEKYAKKIALKST